MTRPDPAAPAGRAARLRARAVERARARRAIERRAGADAAGCTAGRRAGRRARAPGPGARMRRTGVGDLVVPFVVIGLTMYVLLRLSYESIPPLQYVVAVPLGALAVAEFVASRRVRAAVRHDPDAKPMSALVIARCVALGKASSLVGPGVAGAAAASDRAGRARFANGARSRQRPAGGCGAAGGVGPARRRRAVAGAGRHRSGPRRPPPRGTGLSGARRVRPGGSSGSW